jgi:hypothetical protein
VSLKASARQGDSRDVVADLMVEADDVVDD